MEKTFEICAAVLMVAGTLALLLSGPVALAYLLSRVPGASDTDETKGV